MNLKNKIIIVTGGSGLIGKAIVNHIQKQEGIAINADISVETNLRLNNVNLDVSNEVSIKSCLDIVYEKFGSIDGLVNCAYPRTSDWGAKFEEIKLDSWSRNVDMQMNSVFYITQQLINKISSQKCSIVNIGSIYGVVGNDWTLYDGLNMGSATAYSVIKGGIINLTRYLASYCGRKGIRINCVSPGGIFDNQNPVFVERYNAKVPLGRMGNPEDIAPAVSFLLSDEAKYITGQNLIIDGGWTVI